MKKIIGIGILVGVLLSLYLLEVNTSSILDQDILDDAEGSILWFFVIGLTLGSLVCPTCSLPLISFPLASYVIGAESTAKKAFWAALIFQAGRLLVFFLLAVLASVFNYAMPPAVRAASMGLAGVLMILFSVELFGLANVSRYFSSRLMEKMKIPYVTVDHPLQLMIWGVLLGFICSVEYVGIVGAILLGSENFIYTFLSVILFGLGTIVVPTILVVIAGGSIDITRRYSEGNIVKYARLLGGVVLLYIGLEYLISFAFSLI